MTALPLVLLLLVPAEDKPAAKPAVDKEGEVDYQAALNDKLGKGITPEKNANVLLWKALGSRPEGGRGMPPEFFKRMGMDEPPVAGDYFIPIHIHAKEHLKLDQSQMEGLYNEQGWAGQRPWKTTDYPHVASWLKANEKPLAVVVEATKRPDYYNPLVSWKSDKGPAGLISALLPAVQKTRELASALTARAMLRLGEGKIEEAWQDLLAGHRLARLVSRGATLIEALVGIAIEQIFNNANLAYLENAKLTTKQIQRCLKDLQSLPPLPSMADKVDVGERHMFFDCTNLIRHGGIGMLEGLAGGAAPKELTPQQKAALAAIDWKPVLENGSRWYDRMVAAMRLKERSDREKEFDRIDAELKALKEQAVKNQGDLIKALLEGKDAGKVASKAISDVLIGLLMPAVRKVQNAADRAEQTHRNLQMAFHLAAYHRDHGKYPEKPEELVPKYLSELPKDIFSGKALIYKPSENGYLLYSVGVNGKDENGHWYDDDPPGDDPRVKMPLPELKKK